MRKYAQTIKNKEKRRGKKSTRKHIIHKSTNTQKGDRNKCKYIDN